MGLLEKQLGELSLARILSLPGFYQGITFLPRFFGCILPLCVNAESENDGYNDRGNQGEQGEADCGGRGRLAPAPAPGPLHPADRPGVDRLAVRVAPLLV